MIKKYIFALFLITAPLKAQEITPTYYQSGVESPWTLGIDYDLGFARFFSFNLAVLGGISSQVNRASTFGDVYFGEIRTGIRFYMNKSDEWQGVFLELTGRYGIYDLPLRSGTSTVIFERSTTFMLGMGIYLGYRWTRRLVADMSGLPFHMALEPYFGYTLDTFIPLDGLAGVGSANRFSLGLKFTLGFYTYKYRPGTTVTNEDTGQVTKISDLTNEAGTNSIQDTNTNNVGDEILQALPPRVTNIQSSLYERRRVLAMKDPWDKGTIIL
ncbi:MAG: hypothetical protein ACRCY4_03085 [Brevinema sp.]